MSASHGSVLSLGCFQIFAPYIVPALVARLTKLHPRIALTLVEADQAHLIASLRRGEIELALLYDFDLGDDIRAEHLADLVPYVLLPEGHPFADSASLSLESLVSEPLVLLDLDPSRNYFLSLFRDRGLEPRVATAPDPWKWCAASWATGSGYSLLATKPANNMSYDGRALVASRWRAREEQPLWSSPPCRTALERDGAGVHRALPLASLESSMHTRIRKFNTRDTYPEQKLDNDLCQTVVAEADRIRAWSGRPGSRHGGERRRGRCRGASRAGHGQHQATAVRGRRPLEHICKVTIYLTDPTLPRAGLPHHRALAEGRLSGLDRHRGRGTGAPGMAGRGGRDCRDTRPGRERLRRTET